jgi:hypothetical protein
MKRLTASTLSPMAGLQPRKGFQWQRLEVAFPQKKFSLSIIFLPLSFGKGKGKGRG